MYKRYERYKASGREWIGEVPEHWGTMKISWIFDLISSGATPDSSTLDYYDYGTIPWLNTGELNDSYVYETKKYINDLALRNHSALKVYQPQALVIAMYGATIGKLGITKISLSANQACCVLTKPREVDMKFIFYWFFANRKQIISMSYGGGQPNISQNLIKSLRVVLPLLNEQIIISNFLDYKTFEIDSLIADKEELIKRLEEYKQSIITEAVTKGLNPDVKMKDSGIEWIGEVPEHWEIKKLKHVVDLINVKSDNENLPYIGLEHIESLTGKYMQPASPPQPEAEANLFEVEDVLFGKLRPYLAKVFMPTFHGRCSSEFLVLRSKFIQRTFLFYSVLSHHFINIVNSSTYGAKMPRASWNYMGDLPLSIPPEIEQEEIHKLLDTKINSISVITEDSKNLIEILKSYRQSLIFEAVTGKIDVRDYQLERSEQFA